MSYIVKTWRQIVKSWRQIVKSWRQSVKSWQQSVKSFVKSWRQSVKSILHYTFVFWVYKAVYIKPCIAVVMNIKNGKKCDKL